jgi:UDP-glucose 4,6-dehydratase
MSFENNENTRILVTGGAGFIGSNFINLMMDKYDKIKIINLDALYYCSNIENIKEKHRNSSRYLFIKCNLCDMEFLKYIVYENAPTYIIHFAAQSHVDNSFTDSIQFTQDNILGTHTLLEVCRLNILEFPNGIKKIIHVSTDEVYGESMLDADEDHKTEHSILCPTNPYAATKAGAELIAQSYYHSFKLPIVISRGNNVYGPNQYKEKLIPKWLDLLSRNERITIAGSGGQLRSFLHAYDTATAFECLLLRGVIGEIYNIGADEHDEYSVNDVAKIMLGSWYGISEREILFQWDNYIDYIPDRPYNDVRYFISNEKLKALGWDITYTFERGIKELVNSFLHKKSL